MKSKRLFALIMATVVTLSTIPGSIVNASNDSTAPVINSCTITNPAETYTVGDIVTFEFDIVEEETGLSSAYVGLAYSEENKQYQVPVEITENDLSGTYYGSITVTEDMNDGEYNTYYLSAYDKVGNKFSKSLRLAEMVSFFVTGNPKTDARPEIISFRPKFEEVSLEDTQYFVLESNDKDLTSISYRIGCDGYMSRTGSYAFKSIPEDGLYEIPFNFNDSDMPGDWSIGNLYVYDAGGNCTSLYKWFDFTVTGTNDIIIDTTAPTIDSVECENPTIETPGSTFVKVTGTEDMSETVSVTVSISDNIKTRYFSTTADVVEGTYEANIEVSLGSNISGNFEVYNVTVEDTSANRYNKYDDYCTIVATSTSSNVDNHFSLSSPSLVDSINNTADNATILINADSSVVPKNLFTAIQGTNKTLVIDSTSGIQWIFKGSDIVNPKDIDININISEADLEEYGYEAGTNGIKLVFAPNGILPGKADIRIKSDYISKLYGLNTNLWLAFVKSTKEVTEEIITGTEYIYPVDEDGNEMYYTIDYLYNEDGSYVYYEYDEESEEVELEECIQIDDEGRLYRITHITPEEKDIIEQISYNVDYDLSIEDAGIKVEGNYVTITLTHNSSYILVDSLPKMAKNNVISGSVEEISHIVPAPRPREYDEITAYDSNSNIITDTIENNNNDSIDVSYHIVPAPRPEEDYMDDIETVQDNSSVAVNTVEETNTNDEVLNVTDNVDDTTDTLVAKANTYTLASTSSAMIADKVIDEKEESNSYGINSIAILLLIIAMFSMLLRRF